MLFGQTLASFFYLAHEHSAKMLRKFRIFHSGKKRGLDGSMSRPDAFAFSRRPFLGDAQ